MLPKKLGGVVRDIALGVAIVLAYSLFMNLLLWVLHTNENESISGVLKWILD